MALTFKQKRFAEAYVNTAGKGAESARLAGYKGGEQEAWRVLQKPHVQDEIEKIMTEHPVYSKLTKTEILEEVGKQAFECEADAPRSTFMKLLMQSRGMLTDVLRTEDAIKDMNERETIEVMGRNGFSPETIYYHARDLHTADAEMVRRLEPINFEAAEYMRKMLEEDDNKLAIVE